ncbi:hypothetical protein [Saccharibacter floricola]|uniref:hypothetical protein n=1 Tax=Saccharibacter floricola TaxID=231053 RepID=UPI0003665AA7|nr:hypothetical protein [Saccharibacter floricola]
MDTPSSTEHTSDPKPERMVDQRRAPSRVVPMALSVVQNIIWAFAHALSCFLLQITELFAPFLLLIGIAWSLVPHIIGIANSSLSNATNDQQTKELVDHVTRSFPTQIELAGRILTPHGLIMDGILLMVISAIAATCATWLGRRL